MTDVDFYVFWGSCLGFMLLFAAFVGILEIVQKKKDRQRETESIERRRVYEKKQADKKRWEENMTESEKLFKEWQK